MGKDQLIHIGNPGNLKIDPDRILDMAIGKLESVIICGWDKDGTFYGASSEGKVADNLLLLEVLRKRVIEQLNVDEE